MPLSDGERQDFPLRACQLWESLLLFPVVFSRSFNPAKGDSAFCSGLPTSQHQNLSSWVGKAFMVPSVLTPKSVLNTFNVWDLFFVCVF